MTNSIAARGLRDPYRSVGRLGVAALLLWALLSALALTVIGVGAALQGYRSGWSAMVFGGMLILVCVLTGANLRTPRGSGGLPSRTATRSPFHFGMVSLFDRDS